jgi:hypothetical protein
MEDEYPTLVPPDFGGERVYSEFERPGARVDLMARRKARPDPTPEEIEAKRKAYDALTGRVRRAAENQPREDP